ncbi:Serine-rich adhesin for platelets [Lasiodiplodia hormozganensis]|uniref:Serine-rich adhesin for platelets n=1 Tax=Lasiodiplodia hormozganensis TaxID=869390 RepID=A0AA40CIY9_9PEZI|nr:Serine-rich adhesin for platelets [Lasiodiplodia hormozganensis]
MEDLWEVINRFRYKNVFSNVEEAAKRFPDLNHPLPDPPPVEDLDSKSSEKVTTNVRDEVAEDVESAEDAEGAEDVVSEHESDDGVNKAEDEKLGMKGHLINYPAQHAILNNVQAILEHVCFDFLQKFDPGFIAKRRWECAEMAEVNVAAGHMLDNFGVLKLRAGLDTSSKEWGKLMGMCYYLRNYAVHRNRISVEIIAAWVQQSVHLADILGDHDRADQLDAVYTELNMRIQFARYRKLLLRQEAQKEMEVINRKRALLDAEEKEVLERTRISILTNSENSGDLLRSSLQPIFAGDYIVSTRRQKVMELKEELKRQRMEHLKEKEKLKEQKKFKEQENLKEQKKFKEQEKLMEQEKLQAQEQRQEQEEPQEQEKLTAQEQRQEQEEPQEQAEPREQEDQKKPTDRETTAKDKKRAAISQPKKARAPARTPREPQGNVDQVLFPGAGSERVPLAEPYGHSADSELTAVVLRTGTFALMPVHDGSTSPLQVNRKALAAEKPAAEADFVSIEGAEPAVQADLRRIRSTESAKTADQMDVRSAKSAETATQADSAPTRTAKAVDQTDVKSTESAETAIEADSAPTRTAKAADQKAPVLTKSAGTAIQADSTPTRTATAGDQKAPGLNESADTAIQADSKPTRKATAGDQKAPSLTESADTAIQVDSVPSESTSSREAEKTRVLKRIATGVQFFDQSAFKPTAESSNVKE